ncbi:MAG: hypothetical protein JWN78_2003 [Bacteroidota bacterium]|nr:hypothetical protein [Bacteroidota bacterium]
MTITGNSYISRANVNLSLKAQNKRTPEYVDVLIKRRIERLTSENSTVWTSPDRNRREYAHRFFQYPAMMVPIVQKNVIDIIKQINPTIQKVIDPFMGSATSLVACMQNGLNCYGQDINPLSLLIGKTRTGPYYVKAIREKYKELISDIENDKSRVIEAKFKSRNKWFKNNVSIELSRIVRAIRQEPRLAIRRFYWVNLAEIVRITSNDRTSTFKMHARALDEIEKRNLSPIVEFKTHLLQSIEDLELYRQLLLKSNQLSKGSYKGEIQFSLQDSSKKIITRNNSNNFYDLLVTSPPYGDNKTTVTYGQYSYLPLQWIDLCDIDIKANNDSLRTTSEIDSRSLGGKVKKLNFDELNSLYNKSQSFKDVHEKLKSIVPDKADKVVVFLKDLFQVVEKVFEVMKPNSYQVWTIGNRTVGGIEIPNNEILKDFILSKGGILVTKIEREIINKRMAKKNNSSVLMTTEDILIFRKGGK